MLDEAISWRVPSSFLLVCREDLLKHPPSQPTNLALDSLTARSPTRLAGPSNGPLQTCGLLQWNGATLVQRRPGELLSPPTQPPPINPDVAGRIQGGVVDLPQDLVPKKSTPCWGVMNPTKSEPMFHRPNQDDPNPLRSRTTRDARRPAEAEGIAMVAGPSTWMRPMPSMPCGPSPRQEHKDGVLL